MRKVWSLCDRTLIFKYRLFTINSIRCRSFVVKYLYKMFVYKSKHRPVAKFGYCSMLPIIFFVWFDELIRSIDRSIDRGILHWRMGRRNNNVICPLIRFMNWVSCLIATFFNDRIRSHIIVSPVYVRARKLYPYWQVTISNWILKYIYIWIYIYWIYIYGRLVWYDRSVGWFVLSLHFYDFECNLCVWPYATLDWIGLDWSFWC